MFWWFLNPKEVDMHCDCCVKLLLREMDDRFDKVSRDLAAIKKSIADLPANQKVIDDATTALSAHADAQDAQEELLKTTL